MRNSRLKMKNGSSELIQIKNGLVWKFALFPVMLILILIMMGDVTFAHITPGTSSCQMAGHGSGYGGNTCSICGTVYCSRCDTNKSCHTTHNWDYSHNGDQHTSTCITSGCGKIAITTKVTATITTQPTCITKGVRTYTCGVSGCSYSRTEEIDEIGHSYTVACYKPHCTSNVCSGCGDHEADACVECNDSGYCSDCGQSYCDECGHICDVCIHTWINNGSNEKCSQCAETRSHSWGEWGPISRICSTCNAIEYGGLRVHIIEPDLSYSFTQKEGNEVTLTSKVGELITWVILSGNTTFTAPGKFIMPATNVTVEAQFANYQINTNPVSYAATLSQAISFAGNGNTIAVMSDVTDNTPVTIPSGKNLTLDLANNTITTSASSFITVDGDLTITGNTGEIESDGSENILDVTGSLEMQGGNIRILGSRAQAISASGSAEVEITGGTITASGSYGVGIEGTRGTTITLGSNDGDIDTDFSIEGRNYGLLSSGEVNYYDGIISGGTQSIHASVNMPSGKMLGEVNEGGQYQSELINQNTTSGMINHYDGKWNVTNTAYNENATTFVDLYGTSNGIINGATWDENALVFDGTDDWVNLGIRTLANPTVEVVFETNAVGTSQHIISNANSGGYDINLNAAGKLMMEVYNGGWKQAIGEDITVVPGQKYHVVGTYDGSNVNLYINGVSAGSTPYNGSITTATNSTVLSLGTNPGGEEAQDSFFNGKIYKAGIYNRALTAEEVLEIYNGGHVTDGVVSLYDGNYNSGIQLHSPMTAIFADLCYNNNGEITNGMWSDDGLIFDGSSTWVNLDVRTLANPTVEVVFESDIVPTSENAIVCNFSDGGYGIVITNNPGVIQSSAHIGTYIHANDPETVEAGRKYHAVFTYDNSNVNLYIDGVLVTSEPITGNITEATGNTVLAMGTNPNGTAAGGAYFDGKIYKARVYDRALTAAEIQNAYNEAMYGKYEIDIHQGATYANDGTCSICGVKYMGYIDEFYATPYEINTSPATYASTLSDAVALASNGGTITLKSNVTDNTPVTIPSGKNLTLDLSSKTIRTNASNFITVNGGLTVTGTTGRINSTASSKALAVTGSLNVQGGNINISGGSAEAISVSGSGQVVITGGSVTASGSSGVGIKGTNGTTITLGNNDGNIETGFSIRGGAYGVVSPGTINYYDGVVKGGTESIHANTNLPSGKGLSETEVSGIFQSEIINAATSINGLLSYYNAKYNESSTTHSSTTTTFKDLVGTTDGVVNNGTWEEDSLIFDGSTTKTFVNLGVRTIANPTIEVMFETDAIGSSQHIMSNSNSGGYFIRLETDGKPIMSVYSGSSWRNAKSPTAIEAGKKYHAVGTFDGSNVKLYIDGVLVQTTARSGTITTSTNSTVLMLGADPAGTAAEGAYFDGKIYMAKIYNRALTAEEVASAYNDSKLKGPVIHQGGTVDNGGICTICGASY